ncbi:MAG: hypothetical protein P8Y44_07775, partial [Acidobacteriota bacterium]
AWMCRYRELVTNQTWRIEGERREPGKLGQFATGHNFSVGSHAVLLTHFFGWCVETLHVVRVGNLLKREQTPEDS